MDRPRSPHGAVIVKVFFYGLFMDETVLAAEGIQPTDVQPGFLDGYRLRIGDRATLVRQPGDRAYGVLMTIAEREAASLYADASVADYLPEPVNVELLDGTRHRATCYNLPEERVAGAKPEYAKALLGLAARLEFPDSYLDQIRRALG